MNLFTNISDSAIVKEVKSISKDVTNGKLIKEFVLKQAKLIFLIVVCTFIYMNNRMMCEKMLKRIDQLNKELTDTKYVSTIMETELLRAGLQEKIENLVDSRGLDLENPKMPPYKVYRKK
ncbi:MAG: hypothetical protein MJ003_04590 [Paludibacteraceae bacterium]|nr:hypothetical protein [Paludibacteraceae bacterium]